MGVEEAAEFVKEVTIANSNTQLARSSLFQPPPPMDQDLTSPAFLDADAEHRRKIREERYAAKRTGSPASSPIASSPSSAPPSSALLSQLLHGLNEARTQPINVANTLTQRRRPFFQGNELHLPNSNEILGARLCRTAL
jgi:hypothetical protein